MTEQQAIEALKKAGVTVAELVEILKCETVFWTLRYADKNQEMVLGYEYKKYRFRDLRDVVDKLTEATV